MSDVMMRRFAGTQKLYGSDGFDKFCQAHVYVIGVGGVGSWAVEALARTGIGRLTLVDMDVLVESNINRQLPALDDTLGESKIEAMHARICAINPNCQVTLIDDFLTADNVKQILPTKEARHHSIILDCTDDMQAKMAIALHCRFNKLKLIVAGGAGGKTDATLTKVADLKDVYQDPLLARLRQNLRDKNINRDMKQKFGILCVFVAEPPKVNTCQVGGLHCGGYGSAVVVTANVGLVMATEALKYLAR